MIVNGNIFILFFILRLTFVCFVTSGYHQQEEYEECGPFCTAANYLQPIYSHCSGTVCNGNHHCADEQSSEVFDSNVFENNYSDNEREGLLSTLRKQQSLLF